MIANVVRRAARMAIEKPRTAMWTTLALTCALFAVAVAGVAAFASDRVAADRPGSTARMVVYLGDGVTEERARVLVAELRALGGVERAELISATESARRLVATLGTEPALLEGIDPSSLPASVEVTLAPGVRDVVAMSPTVRALRGTPGVVEVVVDDPVEDKIAGALGSVRAIAWGAATLFGVLVCVLALALVRVRLDRDHRELAVAELLGAGPGFTIIPTALAGALQGLVAAALATLLLAVALAVYGDSITASLGQPAEVLALPEAPIVIGFLALGAVIGLLGGGLAGASRITRYPISGFAGGIDGPTG